jgi:glycogen debranching enzyme
VSLGGDRSAIPSTAWLTEQSGQVFSRNRQRGVAPWSGVSYDFVCPSHAVYPFQWFWDSCFHAIALSHVDPERAESEIAGLLANQQANGFIPHVIFWQRERFEDAVSTYAIAFRTRWLSDQMQPPLLAEAVGAVARRGRGGEYLETVLPAVRRYYEWCHSTRDPDGDGLIAVLQSDETGLDHSPKFDSYLGIDTERHDDFTAAWHRVADPYQAVGRVPEEMFALDRFVVEDVMVNTIYAENQRVLAGLLDEIGMKDEGDVFRGRAEATERALVDRCWDDRRGLFFDLAGRDEAWLETNTVTSLFPLLLEDLDRAIVERLVGHLTDPLEYAAPHPVPSVARNEPSYRPGTVGGSLVWRGPTWLNANWYLIRGLRRHGFEDHARHIADRSLELIGLSGFREYYNPETGEGNGAVDFGWSTIVLDIDSMMDR